MKKGKCSVLGKCKDDERRVRSARCAVPGKGKDEGDNTSGGLVAAPANL